MSRLGSLRYVLAVALSCASLPAAPLREADLPEKTIWFAHADFDALRAGELGKIIFDAGVPVFPGNAALRQFEKESGFSVRDNLSGVTAFGEGDVAHNAIVVRHTFPNEKLVAWLEAKKCERAEIAAGDAKLSAYLLSLPMRDGETRKVYIAFPHSEIAVFCTEPERFGVILECLGANKSVSALPAESKKLTLKNPFALGVLNAAEIQKINPHSRIGNGSERAVFAAGAAGEKLAGELVAETKTEAGAKRLAEFAGAHGFAAEVSGNVVSVRVEKTPAEVFEKIRERNDR